MRISRGMALHCTRCDGVDGRNYALSVTELSRAHSHSPENIRKEKLCSTRRRTDREKILEKGIARNDFYFASTHSLIQ